MSALHILVRRWQKIIKHVMLLGLVLCLLWLSYEILKKKGDGFVIAVTIVEEHHEVLPYWMDGARFGFLPKGNITVFHIDGHSDEAPPEYIPELPFFHWPKNESEERAMMQKNDMFIQMAAMVGLLGRFIWLFPNWIDEEDFTNDTVSLGYFYPPEPPSKHLRVQPSFCDCRTSNIGLLEDSGCVYVNYASTDFEDVKMKRAADCVLMRSYVSETVSEDYLYEKMKPPLMEDGINSPSKWIRNDEPVIWDFDLDYFGCDLPGDRLVKAGFTWRVVELIDQKLSGLFCPSRIDHECKSNTIMKDLITVITSECQFSNNGKCNQPFEYMRKLTNEELSKRWQQSPSLFCASNDLQLRNAWKALSLILHHLTRGQLDALSYVAFCFNFSPKTYGAEADMAVQVCHGLNAPDSVVVQRYNPTPEDVVARLGRLERIMARLPPPTMVTICRSARDGYVPRQHYVAIENALVEAIRRSHPENTFRLTYDKDLLGGKEGMNWAV